MRYHIVPAILAATVLAAAPACASRGYYRGPQPGVRVDDRAYRVGYDTGLSQGREDARRGLRFDYRRNRDFQLADRGYDGYGSRAAYQRVFREGFSAGYNAGYRELDRRGGPVYGGPTNGRGPVPGGGAVYRSPAADVGFRDGYAAGRDDARHGHRFDPVRAKRYREGDHDYNGRYGSRDEYKRVYRDAFQRGYEQGYREVRR